MKNYYFSGNIFKVSAVLLVVVLLFSCQKNPLENEYVLDADQLVKAGGKVKNYMVITKAESLPEGIEAKLSVFGKVIKSIPEIGVVIVHPIVTGFESKVAKLAEVQAVVPDIYIKWIEPVKFINDANPPSMGDNEPLFWRLWGLDAINAPEAWNAGYTGNNVKVFVLDSGIDAEHPDLAPNLNTSLSTSFVPDEDYNVAEGFYFNHGTHVAGTIAAAQNNFGVIGVAPKAEIVAVKVLSEYSGSGAFSWINSGIVYAANNGAQVINMSLGATFNRNGFYLDENDVMQKIPAVSIQNLIITQQRAVNYAHKKGAVVIVSAGNDAINLDGGGSLFKIPAGLHNVIAVSATAPNYWYSDLVNGVLNSNYDIPASYTNIGKSLVDIAAPGGDFDYYPQLNWHFDMVLSTIPGGYSWSAGTSMAAPHVSGVAALIIGKNEGRLSADEVARQLLNTADKLEGNGVSLFYGKGRVNAFRAVTE